MLKILHLIRKFKDKYEIFLFQNFSKYVLKVIDFLVLFRKIQKLYGMHAVMG